MGKSCNYSPEFKAKDTMVAIIGRKMIQEIDVDHGIHAPR